jgi:hypothetical protein
MIFELKVIAKHLGLYYQNICKEIWKMSQEFSIKCMIIETNDNVQNWFLKIEAISSISPFSFHDTKAKV